MESFASYVKAKQFFTKSFAPGRKKVSEDLTTFKDAIQREHDNQNIGSYAYTGVGILGGALFLGGLVAAPFTAGASLSVSAAGWACGLSYGLATGLHDEIKHRIVKGKTSNFIKTLKEHERSCLKMNQHLISLIEDLKRQDEINTFEHRNPGEEFKILLSQFEAIIEKSETIQQFKTKEGNIYILVTLERLLKKVSFNSLKAEEESFAAVTFIVDLNSIISDAFKTPDCNKEGLCNEAWIIETVIKRYKREYDELSQCFKSD